MTHEEQFTLLATHVTGQQRCCFEGRPTAGMLRYQYSVMGAPPGAGHPQIAISRLAPDAHNFEPHSMLDCWLFDASPIAELPAHVTLHGADRKRGG